MTSVSVAQDGYIYNIEVAWSDFMTGELNSDYQQVTNYKSNNFSPQIIPMEIQSSFGRNSKIEPICAVMISMLTSWVRDPLGPNKWI